MVVRPAASSTRWKAYEKTLVKPAATAHKLSIPTRIVDARA